MTAAVTVTAIAYVLNEGNYRNLDGSDTGTNLDFEVLPSSYDPQEVVEQWQRNWGHQARAAAVTFEVPADTPWLARLEDGANLPISQDDVRLTAQENESLTAQVNDAMLELA